MNSRIAVLVLTASGALLQAATPVMTNDTIEAMVHGGVPVATIVSSIRAARRIQFFTDKEHYGRFLSAGASKGTADEIMKAIHYREYVGIDRWPDAEKESEEEKPAEAPVPKAPVRTTLPAPVIPPPAVESKKVPVAAPAPAPAPAPVPAPPRDVAPPVPPAPAAPDYPRYAPLTLAVGTPVQLRLRENLSSKDAAVDDTILFEVVADVRVGDQTVIAAGAQAWGKITDAQSSGLLGRSGRLDVAIETVEMVNGQKVSVQGNRDANGPVPESWVATQWSRLMNGKDATIPKGSRITAYIQDDVTVQFSDKAVREAR
jgi:hypothetical protein